MNLRKQHAAGSGYERLRQSGFRTSCAKLGADQRAISDVGRAASGLGGYAGMILPNSPRRDGPESAETGDSVTVGREREPYAYENYQL
jgi:hypothetical protein